VKSKYAVIPMILCWFCMSMHAQRAEGVTTCEYLKNALDYALIDSREDNTAYIDLVFRPGTKERSGDFSIARTKFILSYLKFRSPQFDRILVTHRNALSSLGSLELVVKGEKKGLMFFRKNTTRWNSCVE